MFLLFGTDEVVKKYFIWTNSYISFYIMWCEIHHYSFLIEIDAEQYIRMF